MLKDKRIIEIFLAGIFSVLSCQHAVSGYPVRGHASQYTVINANANQIIIAQSRAKVRNLLSQLQAVSPSSLNDQVAFLTQKLADVPYLDKDGVGESDWQPSATTYQPGALHIMQYPVYRLDGFDCQSFVQTVMALLHSQTLPQFESNLLKISYGAAGNPQGEIVRYYNRNNFVDGDFNPVNQHNNYLQDVTAMNQLAHYAKTTSIVLSRQNWFARQNENLKETVNVLDNANGASMVKRFKQVYTHLNFPHFDAERITIAYIPKNEFVNHPMLLQMIPTPSIVEIVRNPNKWYVGNRKIRDVIGTDLTVSHLGFLYHQAFQYGDLIYRKIICHHEYGYRVCQVTPVVCKKKTCDELMFAHATDAHPSGYYWYQSSAGSYTCSPEKPARGTPYSSCNRIERLPFIDYLTGSQHGWYMTDSSYLGVNVEKIL